MSLVKEMFDVVMQHKDIIKVTILVIVVLAMFGACYGTWNDMWHEFGKNLYHIINGK